MKKTLDKKFWAAMLIFGLIGQVGWIVLVPGIIGPANGAYVLRDAEQIVNQDGTTCFLPHEGIWLAAFLAGLVLCVSLVGIFRMVKSRNSK